MWRVEAHFCKIHILFVDRERRLQFVIRDFLIGVRSAQSLDLLFNFIFFCELLGNGLLSLITEFFSSRSGIP
ncbi:Uncharacterised protein [Klebsiella pneumoniae]|nr:Uncharacterised protein [Klebsiella pneumoniae]